MPLTTATLATVLAVASQTPTVVWVEASSELAPRARYSARNAVTQGYRRSWVEGAPDDGIGEWLRIELDKENRDPQMVINNGLGNQKHWARNNRIKELELRSDVAGSKPFTIELKDSFDEQKMVFPEGWSFRTLTLTIKSVYRGSKYRDTCLALLQFANMRVNLPVLISPTRTGLAGSYWAGGEGWLLDLERDGSCRDSQKACDDKVDPPCRWEKRDCTWDVDRKGGVTVIYKNAEHRVNPLRMRFKQDKEGAAFVTKDEKEDYLLTRRK